MSNWIITEFAVFFGIMILAILIGNLVDYCKNRKQK